MIAHWQKQAHGHPWSPESILGENPECYSCYPSLNVQYVGRFSHYSLQNKISGQQYAPLQGAYKSDPKAFSSWTSLGGPTYDKVNDNSDDEVHDYGNDDSDDVDDNYDDDDDGEWK